MPSLIYSFAQLEAFTAVAEHGSLAKAALKLGKDRTTLRDLIDFLEDGLGYALFLREGRSLHLTPEGEQLQRQAHLLMRQVKAFEAFAKDVPKSAAQEISLDLRSLHAPGAAAGTDCRHGPAQHAPEPN